MNENEVKEMADRLIEHPEYSVICDKCENESTRDGSTTLAAQLALQEGFVSIDGYRAHCAECKEGMTEALAA